MKKSAIVLILFIAVSCKKDVALVTATDLLTSRTWDKPEVIHHPTFGVYTTNSCSESTNFSSNGDFKFNSYCNTPQSQVLDGKWSWVKVGEEIKLEMTFNGIPQQTFRILILELTPSTLHTKQMLETEPLNTADYWELKYKAK